MMTEQEAAEKRCEIIEYAVSKLNPFWLDMFLRAVGEGTDNIWLMKAERLFKTMQREYMEQKREVREWENQMKARRPRRIERREL